MNYLREINAFYDWLETNPLSTSSIALWYALMHMCNKTGWAAEFAVAVSVLCVKTGLSPRAIYKARNELKTKGRLQWKSRNGNQSAIYELQPLCAPEADKCADKVAEKRTDKVAGKRAPLNKLNETKQKLLFMDFVLLTTEEHQKLIDQFGEQKTADFISHLNSYGHQKAKKFKEYTSHYHTILAWDRKDKEGPPSGGNSRHTGKSKAGYRPSEVDWANEPPGL